MSFEFQSTLVNLTPEFRIAGEQIGGVRITTLPSNEKVARVILTSDKDLLFSSAGAPYQAANATDIYATLQPEMAEIVEDELLVNTSAISSVKYTAEEIIINIQGDGLSSESLDEDLHTSSKSENQMKGGFLLDVVV